MKQKLDEFREIERWEKAADCKKQTRVSAIVPDEVLISEYEAMFPPPKYLKDPKSDSKN